MYTYFIFNKIVLTEEELAQYASSKQILYMILICEIPLRDNKVHVWPVGCSYVYIKYILKLMKDIFCLHRYIT